MTHVVAHIIGRNCKIINPIVRWAFGNIWADKMYDFRRLQDAQPGRINLNRDGALQQ